MTKLKTLARRVERLVQENEKFLLLAINDSKGEMLDANRAQLLEGKTSDNKSVGKYQSPSYAKYKKTLNPKGVVDLKVTGRFHDSFFVQAKSFPIIFGARDKKTDELVAKYGDSVFGLTPKSQKSVGEVIKANYLRRVRKFLGI